MDEFVQAILAVCVLLLVVYITKNNRPSSKK